jgi:hypothetical protein
MRKLVLLLAACLASTAQAAEKDFVSSASSGVWVVREYLLCDGDYIDGSAPNACATIDLHNADLAFPTAGSTKWLGMPKFIVADFSADNCTTESVGFLEGRSTATGTRHRLHATGMEIGSAISSVTVNPLSHRFVSFEVTTEGSGGACNAQQVTLRLFYEIKP